jgi:hypothetical protein
LLPFVIVYKVSVNGNGFINNNNFLLIIIKIKLRW